MSGGGDLANDDVGVDIFDRTRFVGDVPTLLVSVMAVRVAVVMSVVVATFLVAMVVAVAAEDHEAEEIGNKTCDTDNEDELGLVDLGGFDESGKGFEDDGDA